MEFDLEVITPAVVGGAIAQKIESDGLRVPTLRGQLRFWFRALTGAWCPIDRLPKIESEVWGSTERASSVVLRSRLVQPTTPGKFDKRAFLNRARETGGSAPVQQKRQVAGLSYLSYGLDEASKSKGRQQRLYWPPGQARFRVSARFAQRGQSAAADPEAAFICSLWLLTHLGGVGSRSRRGWGSLQVVSPRQHKELELVPPEDGSRLAEHIRVGLSFVRKWLDGTGQAKAGPSYAQFSVLARGFSRVVVLRKNWTGWEGLLNDLGDRYREFRKRKLASKRKLVSLEKRAKLGLPLKGYDEDSRLASPFLIHVARCGREYCAILTGFGCNDNHPLNSLMDEFCSEGAQEVPLP